jgi:hypothetical protein
MVCGELYFYDNALPQALEGKAVKANTRNRLMVQAVKPA